MLELVRLARTYWRLARNTRQSRTEIKRRRDEAFRDLLEHAWDETDFYPRYYGEHGIERGDLATIPLEDIPPIDKATYITNFDDITTDDALTRPALEEFLETAAPGDRFQGEYTVVHTSGTTGDPTHFVYDRDAWAHVIAGAFRAVQGDLGLADLAVKAVTGLDVAYVAATEGRFAGVQALESGANAMRSETLLLDVNDSLADWEAALADFDPDVLVGYPSGVKLLCDLVRRRSVELDVFRVITGAEPLSADLRRYVQDTIGTEVFNYYGAGESIVLGVERGTFDGMYLFDDLTYVEPADQVTYITPLYNRSQPLIRYELDDKLSPAEQTGDEPLPFCKIESVVGRTEEIMWLEVDGREAFLHPIVIEDIDVPGVIRTQFVRHAADHVTVRVETTDDADWEPIERAVTERVDEVLQRKGLTALNYDVEEVAKIPIDPATGKRQMVVTAE